MLLSDGISCVLKVPCTEKHEFEKQSIWLAENVKHKDQCPVKDLNIPQRLDRSPLKDVSFTSQPAISSISPLCQNCGKVELYSLKLSYLNF